MLTNFNLTRKSEGDGEDEARMFEMLEEARRLWEQAQSADAAALANIAEALDDLYDEALNAGSSRAWTDLAYAIAQFSNEVERMLPPADAG